MNSKERLLLIVIAANVIASMMHFGHNMAFFDDYPEPSWISNAYVVNALWFLMTPFVVLGYILYRKRRRLLSLAAFAVYCSMSMLVFGHYLYGSPFDLRFSINLLIFLEGVAAATLFGYCIYLTVTMPANYSPPKGRR